MTVPGFCQEINLWLIFLLLVNQSFHSLAEKQLPINNIVVNDTSVVAEVAKNKLHEEIIFPTVLKDRTEEYWNESRHEELTKNEQSIYQMIDTLMKMPTLDDILIRSTL